MRGNQFKLLNVLSLLFIKRQILKEEVLKTKGNKRFALYKEKLEQYSLLYQRVFIC